MPSPVPTNLDSMPLVAESAVFFGHQSVGRNILDGVPLVYATAGVDAPQVVESATPPTQDAAFAHAYMGTNGDPQSKIDAFGQTLRSGMGTWADAAFLKLCYVDVHDGVDVQAVFDSYQKTMTALEQEFPDVAFLHMTVPLTIEPGFKEQIKRLLGAGDHRRDNLAREQYNALVRAEYGETGRLVDIAAMESTTPSGSQVTGTIDEQTYAALYRGFTNDGGHLNELGQQVVAAGLLEVLGNNLAG